MILTDLLKRLVEHQVRFSVIGGVALVIRGVNRTTEDLDISYARDRENMVRIVQALAPIHPTLRGAPKDLPFAFDLPTLRSGLNFTFDTDLGPIDLLGEVAGHGTFEFVDRASDEVDLDGLKILVLTVDGLEKAKRAAGRPKDLLDLGFLAKIKDMSGNR
jgi:hypothetical protein